MTFMVNEGKDLPQKSSLPYMRESWPEPHILPAKAATISERMNSVRREVYWKDVMALVARGRGTGGFFIC